MQAAILGRFNILPIMQFVKFPIGHRAICRGAENAKLKRRDEGGKKTRGCFGQKKRKKCDGKQWNWSKWAQLAQINANKLGLVKLVNLCNAWFLLSFFQCKANISFRGTCKQSVLNQIKIAQIGCLVFRCDTISQHLSLSVGQSLIVSDWRLLSRLRAL